MLAAEEPSVVLVMSRSTKGSRPATDEEPALAESRARSERSTK